MKTKPWRELTQEEKTQLLRDPETPINLTKQAKKSLINWVVPSLCVAVLLGLCTIARSWGDDRYAQKSDLIDEQKKREILEQSVQDMNRKLDLILYIMNQQGKIDSQNLIQHGKQNP